MKIDRNVGNNYMQIRVTYMHSKITNCHACVTLCNPSIDNYILFVTILYFNVQ